MNKRNFNSLRNFGLLALGACSVISFILAMSADMSRAGLGGVFNLFVPPIVFFITAFVFLITYRVTNNYTIRVCVLIACCTYIFYVGLTFKLRPGYLPFPF